MVEMMVSLHIAKDFCGKLTFDRDLYFTAVATECSEKRSVETSQNLIIPIKNLRFLVWSCCLILIFSKHKTAFPPTFIL